MCLFLCLCKVTSFSHNCQTIGIKKTCIVTIPAPPSIPDAGTGDTNSWYDRYLILVPKIPDVGTPNTTFSYIFGTNAFF